MNHQDIQRRLSEYLDEELSAVDHQIVKEHVAACGECADILAQFQRIRAGIQAGAQAELPHAFSSRALRAARLQMEKASRWTPVEFTARRAVLALFLVVLLLVGLTSFGVQQEGVSVERYLSGEMSDSAESRILFNGADISKEDVLLAALSKR
ncbi:MAG: zf-HC2 domain-containing protein [Ignavibacteriales bacterium]|nr:zf-HC2 domain-containing protein [Ignavibacteriales bacterium]